MDRPYQNPNHPTMLLKASFSANVQVTSFLWLKDNWLKESADGRSLAELHALLLPQHVQEPSAAGLRVLVREEFGEQVCSLVLSTDVADTKQACPNMVEQASGPEPADGGSSRNQSHP